MRKPQVEAGSSFDATDSQSTEPTECSRRLSGRGERAKGCLEMASFSGASNRWFDLLGLGSLQDSLMML